MPTITISRSHKLPRAKARTHVEELASELQQELGADYHWEGDTLRFSRSGASGSIVVKPDSVDVEVKLGMLLAAFKGKVESAIADYLDKRLA